MISGHRVLTFSDFRKPATSPIRSVPEHGRPTSGLSNPSKLNASQNNLSIISPARSDARLPHTTSSGSTSSAPRVVENFHFSHKRQPGEPPVGSLVCSIGTEKRRQDCNVWFGTNRRTPSQSRLGRPLYLPCNVTHVRPAQPEPPFGTIVDVPTEHVEHLSLWTPRNIDAQIHVQSGIYRTTTKRGSKAHTVWDSIWERPVVRCAKIQAEIDRQQSIVAAPLPQAPPAPMEERTRE